MLILKEVWMMKMFCKKMAHSSHGIHINILHLFLQQNNSAHNEQNSKMPTPTDCPSFTLKRQSSLTFQSSDPEQIRQSLLTAIRSGEAAAKLKRVSFPYQMGDSGFFHIAKLKGYFFLPLKSTQGRRQKLLCYVRGHF